MKIDTRSTAKKFTLYNQLGWLDRRRFRSSLRWICQDPVSLELLLDFQSKHEQTMLSIRLNHIVREILFWYNEEIHELYLENRIKPSRVPVLLEIVIVFLKRSYELSYGYRDVFLNIIDSGAKFGRHNEADSAITQEQFRLEAAIAISNISQNWGKWRQDLEDEAHRSLGFLERFAHKTEDLRQLIFVGQNLLPVMGFQATCALIEMTKNFHEVESFSDRINVQIDSWDDLSIDMLLPTRTRPEIEKVLLFLETIIEDKRRIENVHSMGFKAAFSLILMCKDFHEFESCSERINSQIRLWENFTSSLFLSANTISELNQMLTFLESVAENPRGNEYLSFDLDKDPIWKNLPAWYSFSEVVRRTFSKGAWKRASEYELIIDDLCTGFEKRLVSEGLKLTWDNLLSSTHPRHSNKSKIRWEFDKFTEYVCSESRNQDWTVDSEKTRRYWNWRDAKVKERQRFFSALQSRICQHFGILTLSEISKLIGLISSYITVQEFERMVQIPTAWVVSTEFKEHYDPYGVNFTEAFEAARPKEFEGHIFTFERPYLQNVIDLVDNVDKIREAIQAHRNSSP